MKKSLSLLVMSLALVAAGKMSAADKPAAPAAAPVDVSGTWNVAVETSGGSGNPVFTFKQEGEKLTGTYQGAFGEAKVAGTLKGNEIKFSFKVGGQDQEMTIDYEGTVENSTMKGKVRLGQLGEGTFTGKKPAK